MVEHTSVWNPQPQFWLSFPAIVKKVLGSLFKEFLSAHLIMPPPEGFVLKLPAQLRQELGINIKPTPGRKGNHGAPGGRKERRKAERQGKKSARVDRRAQPEKERQKRRYEEAKLASENYTGTSTVPKKLKQSAPSSTQPLSLGKLKLKSILKKPAPQLSSPASETSGSDRSLSPGLVLDRSSRAFKDRAAQDDAEISGLEKKLGLKNKKLPKSFDEDGLGGLLEGLDSDDESKKRKRESKDWLQRKRQKAQIGDAGSSEEEHELSLDDEDAFSGGEEMDLSVKEDIEGLDSASDNTASEGSDFEDFDSDEEEAVTRPPKRQRENPYIAPISADQATAKYVPPSRRQAPTSDTEALQRLRRQVQGQLNKLSEANLVSILTEVENLYQSHARQDVTSTLTDLLLSLFCDPSALQGTFVILHAAFIAAAYKIIGTDFGAEITSKLVERLDEYYSSLSSTSGKEAINLISLIAHLYTFHVVGSRLVFDYVRLLLEEISETNTELLLRVVRDVGPQLRQDDPSSLKDIVRIMQNSAAKLTASDQEMSVRTKFMIESITDLKNNKVKAAAGTNGVAIEHITRMRKVLGSLNSRNVRASEPLRIGRRDIKDTEKKGKWWLVGASWKGNAEDGENDTNGIDQSLTVGASDSTDPQETDLLALARQYRMNTSIRRSIFVAIMSASDFQDAHLRLLKLRLKRAQEQEIPKVLLRCASAEAAYNPYYNLIAKKLCTDKRMKMAFQFTIWDFFKKMGEKGDLDESEDEDDDGSQAVELTEIVNLAKMYGGLVADGALSLTLLKTLNLAYLKEQARTFVELLLVVVILQNQQGADVVRNEKSLRSLFGKVADAPQVINGLQLFLKKEVSHSDLASSEKERVGLKWGSKIAIDTLKMLRTSASKST